MLTGQFSLVNLLSGPRLLCQSPAGREYVHNEPVSTGRHGLDATWATDNRNRRKVHEGVAVGGSMDVEGGGTSGVWWKQQLVQYDSC